MNRFLGCLPGEKWETILSKFDIVKEQLFYYMSSCVRHARIVRTQMSKKFSNCTIGWYSLIIMFIVSEARRQVSSWFYYLDKIWTRCILFINMNNTCTHVRILSGFLYIHIFQVISVFKCMKVAGDTYC